MADFASAFAATMKVEGENFNDPQDPGGETYKGAACKMNSKWGVLTLIGMAKKEKDFKGYLEIRGLPLIDLHFYQNHRSLRKCY